MSEKLFNELRNVLKAIDNKIMVFLSSENSEENFREKIIEYTLLEQDRFIIKSYINCYLLNELESIDEETISFLIEKYIVNPDIPYFYTDEVFDQIKLMEKNEQKILENRVFRYNEQIQAKAPNIIKNKEIQLICSSSYILNDIKVALKVIHDENIKNCS